MEMKMAQEYLVVTAYSGVLLQEQVNRELKRGWELWGDLAISYDSTEDQFLFGQTLVKFNYNVPVTTVEDKEEWKEAQISEIPVSP